MALSVDRYSEALFDRFTSGVEQPDAFSHLLIGNHERRNDAHDIVAGRNKEELPLQRGVSESGRRDLELEADHQPLTANLLDDLVVSVLELRQPLAHVQAEPRNPVEEAWSQNDVKCGVADRHRQWVAAKRRAVDAGGEAPGGVRGRETRRHRKAGADALGGGENVGMDATMFVGVEPPGATDAGLHFVEDKKKVEPVADLA